MQNTGGATSSPWRLLVAAWLVCVVTCPPAMGDDAAVVQRIESLGGQLEFDAAAARRVVGVTIADGSKVTADDLAACGRLSGLRKQKLHTLALTNTSITDAAVETIAAAFPGLVDLDLSSNTNLTGAALKWIAGLGKLERLGLLQNRFNDLNTRRLRNLKELQVLDLRGNMEAGDMTLDVLGKMPKLRAFKHRSTVVTDDGIERLAASRSLAALLAQDFDITSAAGPALARIRTLESLEIFRCQGFGDEGVLALAPLKKIERLTLRDLPEVGDAGLAVLDDLPALQRLYLHELASVGDAGLAHLGAAKRLETLDIWSLPRVTDATIAVIAGLPALEELSIRGTGVTDAGLAKLAALPGLHSLTFKDNGPIAEATRAAVTARKWKKLDLGADR
jgi:hypothetical protein